MVLTGRAAFLAALGALLVAGLVASGVTPLLAVAAVNGVLAGLCLVDVLQAAPPKSLRLTRSGDQRVRLGEAAMVSLRVTNTASRGWRGIVRDAWQPTAGAQVVGSPDDRARIHLDPGNSMTISLEVRPYRRGDRPTHIVTLRTLGPLGLAGRQRNTKCPWSVRTLPAFHSRKHLPSRLARLRDLEGRQTIAARSQGTEFDSLREYVPGDDVRSIDWRASARATDLMVRTWRPERDRQVVMVLDCGRTSASRVGDETKLDVSMDAALLLAALAARAGDRVDVMAHDRKTRFYLRAGKGPTVLPGLVDGFALLEPELIECDYRGLVSAALSRVPKRALVVVLTTLDRAPIEEGLLPALPALTSRHLVVVAAVSGTDEQELSPQSAEFSIENAYLHAANAKRAIDEAAVSEQLARLGVLLVQGTPKTLAPRLADAYLDLKLAGRL